MKPLIYVLVFIIVPAANQSNITCRNVTPIFDVQDDSGRDVGKQYKYRFLDGQIGAERNRDFRVIQSMEDVVDRQEKGVQLPLFSLQGRIILFLSFFCGLLVGSYLTFILLFRLRFWHQYRTLMENVQNERGGK